MNYLFLWHPKNGDIKFAEQMFIKGFNAWRIPVLWDEVADLPYDYEQKQNIAVEKMFNFYTELKKIGFEFFIVDAGWGLGSFDENYFYEKIYKKFANYSDVLFDWGETFEDYVETKKMPDWIYWQIIRKEREDLIGDKLTIGATARNKDKLNATSLTSYFNQTKYFRKTDKLVWIFGQVGWHNLFGSLNYEKLYDKIVELGINVVGLYQGNSADWSWIGWENKILEMFNLREKFELKRTKEFLKVFKKINGE